MQQTAASGAAAAGSSFYAGMRILPKEKRQAMYDVYAFCRAVDDIADGDVVCENPAAEMDGWRADIDALYAGKPGGRAAFLKPHVAQYHLKREDFQAVIDGMDMDLHGPIVAPDSATLDLYCDRVASAVGRLSVRIFGLEEKTGVDLAHHLGRALQLTNIARDLDEDAERGRLYLPRENLIAAGVTDLTPAKALAHPGVENVWMHMLGEARKHFGKSHLLMAQAPRKAVRAPWLMAYAYEDVLNRLEQRGFAPPRQRIGVRKARLAFAALRSLL